jgi:hypothetical protein
LFHRNITQDGHSAGFVNDAVAEMLNKPEKGRPELHLKRRGIVRKNNLEKEMNGMVPSGNLSAPKTRIAMQLASYAVRRAHGKRMSKACQDIIVKTSYRHHKPKVA